MLCNTEGYLKNRSGKKRAGSNDFPSQLSEFYTLRQLSIGSSDGAGGVGNSGVRWTSSMTAQNNSCSTDTVGSSDMGGERSGLQTRHRGENPLSSCAPMKN
jgi:hypothetical protein